MLSLRTGCLALLLLFLSVLPLRSQHGTSKADKPSSPRTPASAQPPSTQPQASARKEAASPAMALPVDAVVIVCEHLNEAIGLVPECYVLTRKKYQEMQAELERLRRQAARPRLLAPSTCQLKGKVEGDHLRLQAQLELAPDQTGAVFSLALGQAALTAAQLQGHTPLVSRSEAEGFTVQTDKTGSQQLTLDLMAPLTTSSSGQSLELSLPRAAGTTLELDLPADARDLRINGRSLAEAPLLKLNGNHLSGGLGPGVADKLELSWKLAAASSTPLRMVEGKIHVRLDAAGQSTEAELTLRAEGGPVSEWRLFVPPGARLKLAPGSEERARIDPAPEQKLKKYAAQQILHLKEPSKDPLRVVIAVPSTPLGTGGPLAVGPFFVAGALRQTGQIDVRSTLASLHVDFQPHGQMTRQELSEEHRREPGLLAVFHYSSVPWLDRPQAATGPLSLSWLDVETERNYGRILTRTVHTLSLRSGTDQEPLWYIQTRITATPRWTDVDHLHVKLPSGWEPAEPLLEPTSPRSLSFKLLRDPTDTSGRSPIIGPIEGSYPRARGLRGDAVLLLPHADNAIDQGGEITLQTPIDTELIVYGAERAGLEPIEQTPHRQTWRGRQLPQQLHVEWKPYRPPVQAQSVVDLRWQADRCRVESQQIHFQLPRGAPAALTLRVPAGVSLDARDEAGPVTLLPDARSPDIRSIVPNRPLGKEYHLTLRYTLPLDRPPPGKVRSIALAAPQEVTSSETRVRIWSDPGRVPVLAGEQPGWEEQKIEEVQGRPQLPVLVLQSHASDLSLHLRDSEQTPTNTVLVEQALVCVQILESGAQHYRVFFRLRQAGADTLHVEMPAPVAMLNLTAWLSPKDSGKDGRKQITHAVVNDSGQQADDGHLVRLANIGRLIEPGSLLELEYQLLPGHAGSSPLRSLLQPPLLRGSPATMPLRWLVSVPPGWVLLAPENSPDVERVWRRSGWLLTPRLAPSADELALLQRAGSAAEPLASPSLMCWRGSREPLTVIQVSQQAWLLICSLALLVLGLLLFWPTRSTVGRSTALGGWVFPVLALAALAVGVLSLLWPTGVSAVLYGCEPGAVVLLFAVAVQWLVQERYRRQIVFLPSFSRSQPSPSLLHGSSSQQRPHGEPSTVDAPQPILGSSGSPPRGS